MDGKRQRQLISSVSQILFEQDKKRSQQRRIGTYTTRFFHMCPGAQQIFPEIEEEIGGKDAAMLARMADQIFSIEEKVLAAGEPNEEATSAARKIYSELMSGAKRLGVDDKLDFMQPTPVSWTVLLMTGPLVMVEWVTVVQWVSHISWKRWILSARKTRM